MHYLCRHAPPRWKLRAAKWLVCPSPGQQTILAWPAPPAPTMSQTSTAINGVARKGTQGRGVGWIGALCATIGAPFGRTGGQDGEEHSQGRREWAGLSQMCMMCMPRGHSANAYGEKWQSRGGARYLEAPNFEAMLCFGPPTLCSPTGYTCTGGIGVDAVRLPCASGVYTLSCQTAATARRSYQTCALLERLLGQDSTACTAESGIVFCLVVPLLAHIPPAACVPTSRPCPCAYEPACLPAETANPLYGLGGTCPTCNVSTNGGYTSYNGAAYCTVLFPDRNCIDRE